MRRVHAARLEMQEKRPTVYMRKNVLRLFFRVIVLSLFQAGRLIRRSAKFFKSIAEFESESPVASLVSGQIIRDRDQARRSKQKLIAQLM